MELYYKEESYQIIGKCMEVHNELGHGFLEIVYKDALEILFNQADMYFEREKEYPVYFRGILLKHKFWADFVVFDSIILEVKCVTVLTDEHIAQTINYLKVSGNNLGLLVNFARGKLEYKRLVL
ncbi:GxxExxY protein [Dyadobacter fanqingshengii]|uniref:GxxExxY protein n=1 Tax=Dyadobacter fanqingshengii TaxID=2906443 RepID=A0A9X1PEV6_9BACT|nr:GxxExxY protein [Dyadobacter fanqingshengii]MCF0042495.1 GxxExxY protein [Dyadobacter fanqingshengii]MCF2506685.1 GxxExxY protein [Dyadobacter fanqingshengii]USJ34982.1 GxxExxY protein [Dyadobacter fanqingshengii]